MRYKRDIFIDLLGYRKYGHNEGDEPRFTQPKLYKSISNHPDLMQIYSKKLIDEGTVTIEIVKKIERDYKNNLEDNLEISKDDKNILITPFMAYEWKGFKRVKEITMLENFKTKVDTEELSKVAYSLTTLS